ncbi:MAG TPA: hypothetical protein VK698_24085, partial [Kofleriaceae bacterium]|nr:hypothetical protein [Kofleriaceae bacterium]
FAPDGDVAAFGLNESGQWQVWRLGRAAPVLLHGSAARFLPRLSPDGTLVACARDEHEILLVGPGHRSRRLVELADGEMVAGMGWSPDGRQLAYVRTDPDGGDDRVDVVDVDGADGADGADPLTGAVAPRRTATRRPFLAYAAVLMTWPDRGHVLYAINDRRGGSLYRLDVATGAETLVHQWAGLTITGGRWTGGRLLYNRGTQRYGILLGDRGGPMRRMSSGDGQARRLAGWSEQGWLFYANDSAGTLDIVAHPPDDPPALWLSGEADETPDTLVGGAVLFQRGGGPPGTVGVWRSNAPGDARLLAEVPTAGLSANAVRCAGDRRPPCVVESAAGGVVRYALFDPDTGARGREVATIQARAHYMRSMAVSPDGATLAVVQGGDRVALFDMATGARGERIVPGVADLQSVSWAADGRDLLVSCFGWHGRLFAALRVSPAGAIEPIEASHRRWYWRPQESLDGKQVAVVADDFATDLAALEGL